MVHRFRNQYDIAFLLPACSGLAVSSHGGSQGGYLSELHLLPAHNLGVFVSTTGPNVLQRHLLTVFILDLLLGEEPWVGPENVCPANSTGFSQGDVCSYLHPSSPSHDVLTCLPHGMRNKVQLTQKAYPAGKPSKATLRQTYEGTFSHIAYGNLTLFLNETSQEMNMAFGPVGRWQLEFLNELTAIARGYDVHWYWVHVLVFEIQDDVVTQVETNFEPEAPPIFFRIG